MTVYCPLNQPQCKRSIMTSKGPFRKLECPISKGRKCIFAPKVCPMIYQDTEECYWTKIQDVVDKGGCGVKRNAPWLSQLLCGNKNAQQAERKSVNRTGVFDAESNETTFNFVRFTGAELLPSCGKYSVNLTHLWRPDVAHHGTQQDGCPQQYFARIPAKLRKPHFLPSSSRYPPPNCAEMPPCPRCPFGRTTRDFAEEARNKRKKKKGDDARALEKTEDIKVSASPTHSGLNIESPEIMFSFADETSRKTAETKEPSRLTKTEDIKVSACFCPEALPRPQGPEKVESPETREKIFRDAIANKVSKLAKSRESLLVPQCAASSRRAMPCAGCLVELLSTPPLETQPQTNYVYKTEEERCRRKRIVESCPALRVPSLCPPGCFCPDVALLDEEDDDNENCPFALLGTSTTTKSRHQCPLTRLSNHPLILDPSRVPAQGAPFEACKCPLIPNNCCYTLPGCSVHTMRAIIECPNMKNR